MSLDLSVERMAEQRTVRAVSFDGETFRRDRSFAVIGEAGGVFHPSRAGAASRREGVAIPNDTRPGAETPGRPASDQPKSGAGAVTLSAATTVSSS